MLKSSFKPELSAILGATSLFLRQRLNTALGVTLRSLSRTPNAKSYDQCTTHRIYGLMLKKQATSAEDPEQEDEDAAGVTSVEEIGAKSAMMTSKNGKMQPTPLSPLFDGGRL